MNSKTYGFEITFLIPKGVGYHQSEKLRDIWITPEKVKIRLLSANEIMIQGKGYQSKEDAERDATKVKNSILLCGLLLDKGFDVKELSIREGGVLYISGDGLMSSSYPLSSLINKYNDVINISEKLNGNQILAVELYNMSHFETYPRASFITLISAIECLTIREDRPNHIVDLIKKLKKQLIGKELEKSERDSLDSGLDGLMKESYSKICRKLVKDKLGEKEEGQFARYYRARGAMLHDGIIPENINIESDVRKLREIVSRLLKKLFFPKDVNDD